MLCRRLLQASSLPRPLVGACLRPRWAADAAPGGAEAGKAPSSAEGGGAKAQPAASGGRKSRAGAPADRQQEKAKDPARQVQDHVERLQRLTKEKSETGRLQPLTEERERRGEKEESDDKGGLKISVRTAWRGEPGHAVPYRFRIQTPPERSGAPGQQRDQKKQGVKEAEAPYSDYTGLRFPTLETAENFDYHKDRGLDRVVERAYPIKVPGYRRLDPYLREYIHFLHDLDPARFTISRIAQRYRLREKTVAKVIQEWGVNRYLTRSGLTKLRERQVTREAETLAKKEQNYAKWVGFDQLGDEDDPESDDEALGEFKGWRSTNDWIRRQNVEVEMMSAFPMMEKRNPMPKRVDIDLTVDSQRHHKVINWIDPTDKVVF